jgi:hypothetical protein
MAKCCVCESLFGLIDVSKNAIFDCCLENVTLSLLGILDNDPVELVYVRNKTDVFEKFLFRFGL